MKSRRKSQQSEDKKAENELSFSAKEQISEKYTESKSSKNQQTLKKQETKYTQKESNKKEPEALQKEHTKKKASKKEPQKESKGKKSSKKEPPSNIKETKVKEAKKRKGEKPKSQEVIKKKPKKGDLGQAPNPISIVDSSSDSSSMNKNIVMKLPKFVRATVVNRPSKVVKSPYMADIIVPGESEAQLCHSPALGCSGLIIPGATVLVQPKSSKTAKSKYSCDLVDLGTTIVGANPMFCNSMVKTALLNGLVHSLPLFDAREIKPEHTIDESRFDFKCEKDGITYLIEVKGVPNASTQDPPVQLSKGKKKKAESTAAMSATDEKIDGGVDKKPSLISYFPDGYRKKPNDPISPRAMKHIQHLEKLVLGDPSIVCALVFVIQRSDCQVFQPTKGDPLYRKAVHQASQSGVKILPHVVSWSEEGEATWNPDCLPMNLKDNTDQW